MNAIAEQNAAERVSTPVMYWLARRCDDKLTPWPRARRTNRSAN